MYWKTRGEVKSISMMMSRTNNLSLSIQESTTLGKYGRLRKSYLKEHRPVLFSCLLLSEKLYPHLQEFGQTANSRLEQMMTVRIKAAGANERLKEADPMKWVGLMNNCKAQAEETILQELIYS